MPIKALTKVTNQSNLKSSQKGATDLGLENLESLELTPGPGTTRPWIKVLPGGAQHDAVNPPRRLIANASRLPARV